MTERNCTTCGFETAPRNTTVCMSCLASQNKSHWRRKIDADALIEARRDEDRMDVVGQNGNDGLHYIGSAIVAAAEGPKVSYDNVNKPKHYQVLPGVEVMDIRRALLNKIDDMPSRPPLFAINCWDRALEYTIRAWEKNGVEDLKKAARYLELCIEEFEPK